MKIYSRYLSLIFSLIILISFNNCSSDSPNGSEDEIQKNYFPVGDGTYYIYDLSESDSTGILRTGSRSTKYNGTTLLNSITYSNQQDSVILGIENSLSFSYFRKTLSGIYYFVDTSEVMTVIPDTLREFVTLQTESRFILFPLEEGSSWPVYRIPIRLPSGINFTALEITGEFDTMENIELNLISGVTNVATAKVQFDLEFILDLSSARRKLTGFGWFAENIGLVKLEGNSVVLGALLGGEINFDDSTKTITQQLIDYDVE